MPPPQHLKLQVGVSRTRPLRPDGRAGTRGYHPAWGRFGYLVGAVAHAALDAGVVDVVAAAAACAAAAWAAPATPSVALRTVRSLGGTMSVRDWVGMDRCKPGCHGGLEAQPRRGWTGDRCVREGLRMSADWRRGWWCFPLKRGGHEDRPRGEV